ncbi:unnamed protein product [Adineta steineri]|uniref:Aspergillus nuclease S(1) n=1 Tax=Adineta steineri TaxID=433720 RepID=A0A814PKD4_9BILA|nr:unnamed protein product [Adineta steineri]CAF1107245.1 unnamed protein product [Adineta steineri]
MLFSFSFIILCQTFLHVYGWGGIGHSIVVQLAQSQLTGSAPEWIRSLTPWHWNGNLSAMASWADSILYADTNPTGFGNWQWTRPFHYINVPDWNCSYDVNRDCINDVCIDGAIRNYTKRLQSSLDHIQHEEALYFLIHYVGDIHQPMHTGFKSDYGGNSVRVRFMNRTALTNLHSLWDSGMIDYRIQQDFNRNSSRYYEFIHGLMVRQFIPPNDDDIQQWISESLNFICQEAYFDDANRTMNASMTFNLTENYFRRVYPIFEQRLAAGGRRLGALLNRLALAPGSTQAPASGSTQTPASGSSQAPTPPPSATDKLCLNIYILTAVFCFEFILSITLRII